MFRLYFKGLGMMLGMIVGAGIFALPYVFSRAGFFWGIILFGAAFLITLFLSNLYGEIAYYTRGKHRYTGYVNIFLGRPAKHLAFLTTIASYYGSLLIYGLLGGLFLFNVFGNLSVFKFSLIFFSIAAVISWLNIEKVSSLNFYLTLPIFGFIIYLIFIAFPYIKIANFTGGNFVFNSDWFLPYGVWIFALGGFAALPETRDIFSKSPLKHFKRVIFLSLAVSAIFYFFFIFSVLGANGQFTTKDALSGLLNILGKEAFLIGSLIGFFAVFTSYIALAFDMKCIFNYDYKISPVFAWLLAVIPPIILFLAGIDDVVKLLEIIGAVGLGILGVFIILMRRRMRKRVLEGDEGDLLKPVEENEIRPNKILEIFILIGIIAGVIYELWRIFVAG
jgi:amino acid permease